MEVKVDIYQLLLAEGHFFNDISVRLTQVFANKLWRNFQLLSSLGCLHLRSLGWSHSNTSWWFVPMLHYSRSELAPLFWEKCSICVKTDDKDPQSKKAVHRRLTVSQNITPHLVSAGMQSKIKLAALLADCDILSKSFTILHYSSESAQWYHEASVVSCVPPSGWVTNIQVVPDCLIVELKTFWI